MRDMLAKSTYFLHHLHRSNNAATKCVLAVLDKGGTNLPEASHGFNTGTARVYNDGQQQ